MSDFSRYFRPRMFAELFIPSLGKTVDIKHNQTPNGAYRIPAVPTTARLCRNDHQHADELTLTFDYRTIPLDPRFLRNAEVNFYMDDADDSGHWDPDPGTADASDHGNLRFIGLSTKPARRASDDGLPLFECSFLDATTRFISCKPFPTAGVPDLSQTLEEAWGLICNNVGWRDPDTKKIVSSVKALRDRLVFSSDITSPPKLSDAVSKRFAKLGKVVVKPDTDAWAVWQQCVGMCGLISYIYLDQCIVTTADNHYRPLKSAIFTWGKNISSFSEGRNELMSRGIGVTSFDPLGGKSIEAFWPPPGDPALGKKRITAGSRKTSPETIKADEYTIYPIAGVTEPAALLSVAQRIYEERSRQEIEGVLTTKEMTVKDAKGKPIDILDMAPGDGVIVGFDPEMISSLASLATVDDKVELLARRGIPRATAAVLVDCATDLVGQPAEFLVKSVTTSFESTHEGGDVSFEIHFCNRIRPDEDGASTGDAA